MVLWVWLLLQNGLKVKKKQFKTRPGLTETTIATAEGYLSQERINLQSTKPNKNKQKPEPKTINDENFLPQSDFPNVKTYEVLYFLTTSNNSRAYTDLTGKFPVQSSRGNNYVLIAYTMMPM